MRAQHPRVHYEQVAEVYAEAIEADEPPAKAVALAWSVPQTTAHRWVRRARELGTTMPLSTGGRRPGRCRGRCPECCP